MITFQLESYWGSRFLMIILAFNFLVPVLSFSMMGADSLKKTLGAPNESDRFMRSKGTYCSFKQARSKREFWLILFSFAIIIGISKMMDENATIIALKNSSTTSKNQRSFQVFEIIGAFTTGVFLSFFRVHVSPYFLYTFYALLLLGSQVLMFFISVSTLALYVAMMIVGFVEGGTFVLAGIIAHEDYGSKKYAKILGIFMTGAALGIFLFEKVIFDWIYSATASSSDISSLGTYGKWNKYIFLICLLSSVLALIMAAGSYMWTKKNDKKSPIAEFVNF
jgi:MFS family permease